MYEDKDSTAQCTTVVPISCVIFWKYFAGFYCLDINWDTMSVNQAAQDREIQRSLLDVVTSHAITQIHETPTRGNNLLDIILTSNPSLIKSSINAPGISDHDMIITDCEAVGDLI
jgi:hypothetical protein